MRRVLVCALTWWIKPNISPCQITVHRLTQISLSWATLLMSWCPTFHCAISVHDISQITAHHVIVPLRVIYTHTYPLNRVYLVKSPCVCDVIVIVSRGICRVLFTVFQDCSDLALIFSTAALMPSPSVILSTWYVLSFFIINLQKVLRSLPWQGDVKKKLAFFRVKRAVLGSDLQKIKLNANLFLPFNSWIALYHCHSTHEWHFLAAIQAIQAFMNGRGGY